jgi:hypothetical protein
MNNPPPISGKPLHIATSQLHITRRTLRETKNESDVKPSFATAPPISLTLIRSNPENVTLSTQKDYDSHWINLPLE